MDDLDKEGKTEVIEIKEEINPNVQRKKNISTGEELKKVFTSKSQFKEFMNFINNGFKIK